MLGILSVLGILGKLGNIPSQFGCFLARCWGGDVIVIGGGGVIWVWVIIR